MTSLYDFLWKIKNQIDTDGSLEILFDNEQLEWLDRFLSVSENEIHFRSKQNGEMDANEEPLYEMHYQIAGEPEEIHSLLCEAMLENYQFARLIVSAAQFYKEHVPICTQCSVLAFGMKKPPMDWSFKKH